MKIICYVSIESSFEVQGISGSLYTSYVSYPCLEKRSSLPWIEKLCRLFYKLSPKCFSNYDFQIARQSPKRAYLHRPECQVAAAAGHQHPPFQPDMPAVPRPSPLPPAWSTYLPVHFTLPVSIHVHQSIPGITSTLNNPRKFLRILIFDFWSAVSVRFQNLRRAVYIHTSSKHSSLDTGAKKSR